MTRYNLPEQIAFDYTKQYASSGSRRARADGRGRNNVNGDHAGESRRRRVRLDQESVQPSNYAERRARYHRQQGQQYTARRAVSRTFAQTGLAAPEGLVRPKRSLPPMRPAGSPIPPRSSRVRKRGFWRRVLGFFAVLALVVGAVGFALFSPSFHVRSVAVMGTTNQVVLHAVGQMNMVGQNIFLIDVTSLTSQVDALPPVESANIQKIWPDQLVVNIVERLPVVLWQTPQQTYSVDSHGVVIAPASATSGVEHLMTIVDMRSKAVTRQVHPGAQLNAADIAFALQVFEQTTQVVGITQYSLRYSVVDAQATDGSFSIVSSDGWVAYLGSADDSNPLSNRLIELQQILKKAQQNQWTLATIDLRYGLRPVFTLKS
jgi:cell division septal protein FtsQ